MVRVSVWDRYWTSRSCASDYYPTSPTIVRQIVAHVAPGSRILEVGPGTARDSAELAAAGYDVVVLDSSLPALELAAEHAPSLIGRSLVAGDGLRAPFPDGSFDAVFHQGLLEHFRDPLPLLLDNRRLLRPAGILVVDVPQTFHPWTLLKKPLIAAGKWFAGWETQYTPAGLERVVRQAGFEVLATYGDWMRPSLAYRCLRAGLGKAGILLPQQPPRWQEVQPLRRRMQESLLAQRPALWTAFTVGVVARRR